MKRITPVSPQLKMKRKEIDRIDEGLLNLLNRRIQLVREAMSIKKETGEKLRVFEREREIILSLKFKNRGPLKEAELERIFRAILAMGRRHAIPRRSPDRG